jgi:hypothetical protein
MRGMVRACVLPPRTLSQPVAERGGTFTPWVEVSAQVVVRVAAWGHEEAGWVHWAAPVLDGEIAFDDVRPCDPSLRAGRPGGPEGLQTGTLETPSESEIRETATRLWSRCRVDLYRLPTFGLISGIGEPKEAFRRRCLGLLGPGPRREAPAGPYAAVTLARLAPSIETVSLGPDELDLRCLEGRIGWYPPGHEPSLAVARGTVTAPERARR